MAARNGVSNQSTAFKLSEATSQLPEVLTHQAKLRNAMFQGVTEDDIQTIVKKQVEKAKNGDEKSLKFVTEFLLGNNKQNVTLVQENHTHVAVDESQRQTIIGLADKGMNPNQIAARLSLEAATVASVIRAAS